MLRVELRKRRGSFTIEAAFEAPLPAVVALFGPSGCGKTTLVEILAGLLAPDAGRIELDGEVLCDTARGISVPAESRRVGYVFQDARLFPHLDVRDNLTFGLKRHRHVPVRIPFDEVVDLLGLEALLTRRPGTLSGGERQRVALGRALLSQPRLLLLDEPLASLDAARREEILPYLERLRDRWQVPMVHVSHQFEEVLRLATHVVALDAGRVLTSGPLVRAALDPALGRLVGAAAVGAVLETTVAGIDATTGLCRLPLGDNELRLLANGLAPGTRVRLQMLARDVIVATRPPEGLSVRNVLRGHIAAISAESADSDLVSIDIGGALILARITRAATQALALAAGQPVWALVKAVSLRGRAC
ncbi:MAG: molybdenum ABC transporter ATP-binding protein [Gammaproteobacteria bacterium]|nr:molybdenum ABC transporter ATP-binding protein [Gammaproteobacteria bacterium]